MLGSRLYIFGCVLFVLAKLYLVLPTTYAVGVPRLGDDALVYLWKGHLAGLGGIQSHRGLTDIVEQRVRQDDPSPDLNLKRAQVSQRTVGDSQYVYSRVTQLFGSFIGDPKWVFFATELVGIFLMAVGISWFLAELVGKSAAGLALIFLAFAILPNQGMYAFIPSTLALSAALCLWAYLWRNPFSPKLWGIALATFIILGIHPIGLLYVLLTPLMLVVRLNYSFSDYTTSVRVAKVFLMCISGLALSAVYRNLDPTILTAPNAIEGSIAHGSEIFKNLGSSAGWIFDPIIRKNLLLFACLAVSAVILKTFIVPPCIRNLGVGTLLVLAGSLYFYLPGYPAELFSRVFVFAFIILSGVVARLALVCWEGPMKRSWLAVAAFSMGTLLSAIHWVLDYVPHVMNWRKESISAITLKERLEELDSSRPIVYAETDYSLTYSMLQGGWRYPTIAFNMLKDARDLERVVRSQQPQAILVKNFDDLNTLSKAGSKTFLPRAHSLHSSAISGFTLIRDGGSPMSSLSLLVRSPDGAGGLYIKAYGAGGAQIAPGLRYAFQDHYYGWIDFNFPGDTWRISVEFLKDGISVEGVRGRPRQLITLQDARIRWPWSEGWGLSYSYGDKKQKTVVVRFTSLDLLETVGASELAKYVSNDQPVLADDSGIVFMRAGPTIRPVERFP
jgi:hypothetical protein